MGDALLFTGAGAAMLAISAYLQHAVSSQRQWLELMRETPHCSVLFPVYCTTSPGIELTSTGLSNQVAEARTRLEAVETAKQTSRQGMLPSAFVKLAGLTWTDDPVNDRFGRTAVGRRCACHHHTPAGKIASPPCEQCKKIK